MNESFSSSAGRGQAPIASPHGRGDQTSNAAPPTFAAVLGQSLLLGFVGQIVFTVLQLSIAGNTHGQAQAGASVDKQLLLLALPILCAIAGALDGRAHPSRKVGHPLSIFLLLLAVGVVGLFNLFVMALTGMAGYC